MNLEEISESEALNQLINARNELTTKATHSTN